MRENNKISAEMRHMLTQSSQGQRSKNLFKTVENSPVKQGDYTDIIN